MPSMTRRQLEIQDKLLRIAGDFDTLEKALRRGKVEHPQGPTMSQLIEIIRDIKADPENPTRASA
jgi:ribosomal 50S subunit-associated protein YjgA (DUF615 family)